MKLDTNFFCLVVSIFFAVPTLGYTPEGASSEPYLTVVGATEDGLRLKCDVRGALPKPEVELFDSSENILPAEETHVSERDGRYYVTTFATVKKSGRVTCIVRQKEINHGTFTETFVSVSGASPRPYLTVVNATEDEALLKCVVEGAQGKPEVELWDSSGNILPAEETQVSERDGRYYVTTSATVKKRGSVRCIVRQKEINHETFTETFVSVSGKADEKSCTGSNFVSLFGGMVLGAAFVGVPWLCLTIKRRKREFYVKENGYGSAADGSHPTAPEDPATESLQPNTDV